MRYIEPATVVKKGTTVVLILTTKEAKDVMQALGDTTDMKGYPTFDKLADLFPGEY